MGLRGELFSTRVILQNRTYFFNVKENRMGDLYLNIVESKNRDEGGFDRQSVILFADDLQEFLKGFDESLRILEKETRERRRSARTREREGGSDRTGDRGSDRGSGRTGGNAETRSRNGRSDDRGSGRAGSRSGGNAGGRNEGRTNGRGGGYTGDRSERHGKSGGRADDRGSGRSGDRPKGRRVIVKKK